MAAIASYLTDDHRHCDEAFLAIERAIVDRRWEEAGDSLAVFTAAITRHFASEEELLFPAFEAATGMSAGPTQMMRYEHDQMRGLLARMAAACEARDSQGYGGDAETLLMLMQQHNMKEEHILYPMCDQSLGADAERVGAKMEAMLEKGDG